MGTSTAGDLLLVYSRRLDAHRKGLLKWPESLQPTVERFVEALSALPSGDLIEIDTDVDREPIYRFVRVSTGELLAEVGKGDAAQETGEKAQDHSMMPSPILALHGLASRWRAPAVVVRSLYAPQSTQTMLSV